MECHGNSICRKIFLLVIRFQLILNAKCHAIRDAQILEKRQIKGEMTEEEKRLDIMMEVDRQNAITIQV